MKSFDVALLVSGAASLLAALISIIGAVTNSKKPKQDKKNYVILTFLAIILVWGGLLLFAKLLKVESDLLNFHPASTDSPNNSPSVITTDKTTEYYSVTPKATDFSYETDYSFTQPVSTPSQSTTEYYSGLLPASWFEDDDYIKKQLSDCYDRYQKPLSCGDNTYYLVTGCTTDSESNRSNGLIIDNVEYCDSFSVDPWSVVGYQASHYVDFIDYKAIYCTFHFEQEIHTTNELAYEYYVFNSNGDSITLPRSSKRMGL